MKRILVALVLALAYAAPAAAQDPSPARLQAARALLDGMNMQQLMEETARAAIRQQVEQQPMMAQFEDILRETMSRALRWEDLREDYVRMYAAVFTEDELRQLGAFYRTPVGRRLLSATPEITTRSMEITNRRMEQVLPEMQERIMQRMTAESGGGENQP